MNQWLVSSRRRSGMTLVEVLVVIAVIGVLVGLLIPAVMSARTAARKTQCGNNLKQLGSAVQQFHERNNRLPVYWGGMNGSGTNALRSREHFGGWLLHLLPDLDQQAFYDSIRMPSGEIETGYWIDGEMTDPGEPATPDYVPGTWITSTTGYVHTTGVAVPIIKRELVGRKGTPRRWPRYQRIWVRTGSRTEVGMASTFPVDQSKMSLGVLQCGDDVSTASANAMVPGLRLAGDVTAPKVVPWSLTNYLANAHVFTMFNSGRLSNDPVPVSGVNRRKWSGHGPEAGFLGLFESPSVAAFENGTGNSMRWDAFFTHQNASVQSIRTASLSRVVDGLSNTILFGEAMRQCDNNASYRYAFLPTRYETHEHAFGIEPIVKGATTWYGSLGRPHGNTLMFQTKPNVKGCNKFRLQGNHGGVLMTVMCDGSIRAISPTVSHREAVDPDVEGRAEFSPDGEDQPGFYTDEGRGFGDVQSDNVPGSWGVWDMLMVGNDQKTLLNSGEVGKEGILDPTEN